MQKDSIKASWPIVGNDHIKTFLSKTAALAKGKKFISGCYIFQGPDDLGKTTAANFFAQILLCQKEQRDDGSPCGVCPSCLKFNRSGKLRADGDDKAGFVNVNSDLNIIKKDDDKKNISIDQIRDFISRLSMSSFLNSYKIGIIKDAHLLSESASNALLKTLEEPRDKVVIILITSNLEALPTTIVSRSQVLRFSPVKSDLIYDYLINEHGAKRSEAKNFSRLSFGRPALAVKFLEDKNFYENYLGIVNSFLGSIRVDMGERFSFIENVIKKKEDSRGTAEDVKKIIDIWQGIVRDLLLIGYNQADLIQNHIVEDGLGEISGKFNTTGLVNMIERLSVAKKYVEANVNPKLVLENIMINF